MKRKILIVTAVILIAVVIIFNACSPLREFGKMPAYEAVNNFTYPLPVYDSLKKTVVVITNNDGTELFDMMAPYYLFNATGKANVYLVAKNKFPIVVKKGFYVLPQFSFGELDSMRIRPDVIVIPFLNAGDSIHQDRVIINWIKQHYLPATKVLSVCDGSATAAATGIFDGKPITAHASDFAGIKAQFSKPLWVQNISVVNSGNLYSTAGVSNAAEGSLMLINDLFGVEVMKKVKADIAYPSELIKMVHQSKTFHFSDKITVAKKIFFRSNKKLGIVLQEGINEFDLAAVMDTYNRTFPKSIESFTMDDLPIKTRYGLTIIPSGKISKADLDELHVINNLPSFEMNKELFKPAKLVTYTKSGNKYIIDECLERIKLEYGGNFEHIVKLMLDYN